MASKKMSVIPQTKKQPTPEEFVRGANIQEQGDFIDCFLVSVLAF